MSVNSDESILNIWICALSRHGLHNDIMIWKRFQHYWPFVCGIHQSLVDSPHKGPVAWIFDVSFGVTLNKLLDKRTSGRWFNSLRPSDAYVWMNYDNIGSDNGLLPGWCQDIIWTNVHLFNYNLRNKLQRKLNPKSYIFIQENASENVIWRMSVILSQPQCVKMPCQSVDVTVMQISSPIINPASSHHLGHHQIKLQCTDSRNIPSTLKSTFLQFAMEGFRHNHFHNANLPKNLP